MADLNDLIAGGIKPAQVDDLATAQAKALQLANEKQQQQEGAQRMQMGALQLQQLQRDSNDQDVIRQAFMNANGDPAQMRKLAIQNGASPKAILALDAQNLDVRTKLATLSKDELENTKNAHDAMNGSLRAYIGNPSMADKVNGWRDYLNQQVAAKHITQQEAEAAPGAYPGDEQATLIANGLLYGSELAKQTAANRTADARATTADIDKKKFTLEEPGLTAKANDDQIQNAARSASGITDQASWDKWYATQPAYIKSQISAEYSPDEYARLQGMAISPDEKAKIAAPQGEFERDFLPAFSQQRGKTPAQLSPPEKIAALGEFNIAKQDPQTRASMEASRALSLTMKTLAEGQIPTQAQADTVAQDLISHRIAPEQFSQLMGRDSNGNFRRMIYAAAKQRDPNFDFEQASSEYQLSKSPGFQNTVRNMDSVQESMPRLLANAQKLDNGQIRSINNLVNSGRSQFNDVDLAKFNTDRLLVSDEIAKILSGGGTGAVTSDAKLAQAQSILKESDDPHVIAATLGEANTLMTYRRQALTRGTYMEHVAPGVASGGVIALAPLPMKLSSADVGKTYTNKAGKTLRITAVNPADPTQFKFDEVTK